MTDDNDTIEVYRDERIEILIFMYYRTTCMLSHDWLCGICATNLVNVFAAKLCLFLLLNHVHPSLKESSSKSRPSLESPEWTAPISTGSIGYVANSGRIIGPGNWDMMQ